MTKIEYLPTRNLCRLVSDHLDDIRHHFSVPNKNAGFIRRATNQKFVPSRLYCITPTGLFSAGLTLSILQYLKDKWPSDSSYIEPAVFDQITPKINATFTDDLKIKLRDYQIDIVKRALVFGRGIIKLGTGGGKTLTIASLLSCIYKSNQNMTCLLIVPDLALVYQTFSDFNEYGVPFTTTKWTGEVGAEAPKFDANVIIANAGIIRSRIDDEQWLKNIGYLVVDEVHKLRKGNEISKVIESLKTPYKFGLTGTMPEDQIDAWNVIGKIGAIIYNKSSAELRDEKYLSSVDATVIRIKYLTPPDVSYQDELVWLNNNTFRNSIIKVLCNKAQGNTLVLVNRIDHGIVLHQLLTDALPDKKVRYIRGEVEVEDRRIVIDEMENCSNVVCVAISAIFSTGINIKNLHNVMFASGGKSLVRVIQSIGRGLRLHASKSKLTIYDIADEVGASQKHAFRRQEIYTIEKIPYKIGEIVEK